MITLLKVKQYFKHSRLVTSLWDMFHKPQKEQYVSYGSENPDKTLVIAAHGGVIRTLLCHALGMPLKNMWRIHQDNTAVNLVTAYNEGLTVELMNSTVHLSDSNLNMNLNTWVKKS